ncbi:MAG: phytanoyl-CoA dioxygenase family protein [Myxococcota bacterium]
MSLSPGAVQQFRDRGFVVVPDLLGPADLSPLIAEIEDWVDHRARELFARGQIQDPCEEEPFERRYARLHAQSPWMAAGLDVHLMRGRAMFELLRSPRLLDAVESLVGPEILLNPIHHLRGKLPQPQVHPSVDTYFNVPWHQDSAVMWEEADPVPVVGLWIPLVDATEENGCMEILPDVAAGGHLPHQAEGGTTIVPERLPRVEPVRVECRRGGVVFQDKFTPHRSTPNRSQGVRWSLDVRYQPADRPTGRPFHPAFVVRSASAPERCVRDHGAWSRAWEAALFALSERPAPPAHRVVR